MRAELCKPIQTCLMVRASFEALRSAAPIIRPFVVSRAGFAGMQVGCAFNVFTPQLHNGCLLLFVQRYAQTWSGDNTTSWESLRYGLRMGLGLALSGVANAGSWRKPVVNLSYYI